ncbi:(S)-ureidoglycine aminohydrolase [Peptoclostridium litorale DSM 5388]|uniref:Cupin type-2 domain-containing protein n=1 Tax=Peptoclostridium litorale DSM 5388 TaxID=1121324 RepID=A0A069RJH1_PEPLI|nr:(S)-ureidoglycine aminohydrolase [Peptoclostridium litorale]KDR96300.1 hypothetical protein CLIT_4c01370 [Peptoclostridium litorale DSM 5388]SIO25984.1 (S)-ureidoglycine aminohydrolase [Peptoclostridium litorale DSM 5388]
MGYPNGLLETRAVIKPGRYTIIPPDGLVNNVIPSFKNIVTSIIASPKYGASFVQYLLKLNKDGECTETFGGDGRIETFIYCLEGEITVTAGEEEYKLTSGGYVYSPAKLGMKFKNAAIGESKALLYKQVFVPTEGKEPWVVFGNTNDIEEQIYDGMENVKLKDLLPIDTAFDMNMHILSFEPGGCHPFVETHVQEHGAYMLSGEGVYNLDNEWIPVQKEDFIWFGPYTPQAVYCSGRENLTYIYSKDCNRDVEL